MSLFSNVLVEPSWRAVLAGEFLKPYFQNLESDIAARESKGAVIYPPRETVFSAFNLTPLETVKVVILGQDPYHGAGQAMGLSFSVPCNMKPPPSLRNILKEIMEDIGSSSVQGGDLSVWAKQGVLLLNSVLTVEDSTPNAHKNLGWETFTDQAISTVSENCENVVFLLWGGQARQKAALVNEQKHKVLTAPHPSPLSSYRGFFGCKHFSQTNNYLAEKKRAKINW